MTGLKNAFRLLVALLVVASTVPAPALAQSDNEYSHQFTGGPQEVVVDQSNITGDFTVTVSTTGATGRVGEKTLLAQKYLGPGTEEKIVFMNEGAYDNVTIDVTVHDSGEPSFQKGSEVGIDVPYIIGHTGGDRDLQCNQDERIFSMTNPMVEVVDCTPPVDNGVNTSTTDAEQIKTDIYQSSQNQHATGDIFHTTLDNYLEDTKTQARIVGKNAYIRALNNGSTQAAAETAAKSAVSDYYAVKQKQLINNFEAQVAHYDYVHGVAGSEADITNSTEVGQNGDAFVGFNWSKNMDSSTPRDAYSAYLGTTSSSYTLVNGTSTSYTAFRVEAETAGYGMHQNTVTVDHTADYMVTTAGPDYPPLLHALEINGPTSSYDDLDYLDPDEYGTRMAEIESQHSTVISDMETLSANTYDAYQSGEINNSDLVDPYVLADEFSAGDEHQSWAAAQLTMLGTNSPEAMSNMGEFNVTTADGTTHTGILMSQSNPASGQFEVNTTYDTTNITGPQFVVTPDRLVELDGEFTIDSIETTDGESRQNVTIEKTTYETADVNVTQLLEEYEQLQKERAEWESREQNMRGGAGGFAFGNSTGFGLLAALAGALILYSKRESGGRY